MKVLYYHISNGMLLKHQLYSIRYAQPFPCQNKQIHELKGIYVIFKTDEIKR